MAMDGPKLSGGGGGGCPAPCLPVSWGKQAGPGAGTAGAQKCPYIVTGVSSEPGQWGCIPGPGLARPARSSIRPSPPGP